MKKFLLKYKDNMYNIRGRNFLNNVPPCFLSTNTIFIHIPKAAGSTINLSLFGYRLGHWAIEDYWYSDPDFTKGAFKFTFVRHPYFRFVSAYNYLLSGGISERDEAYFSNFPKYFKSIRSFAEASESKFFRNQIIHLRPQYHFLSLPSTSIYKVYMDFVGKTEFINQHIDILISLLPSSLTSRLLLTKQFHFNKNLKSHYEVERDTFQKIRKIYQDDFELFGYDEWGTADKSQKLIESL